MKLNKDSYVKVGATHNDYGDWQVFIALDNYETGDTAWIWLTPAQMRRLAATLLRASDRIEKRKSKL